MSETLEALVRNRRMGQMIYDEKNDLITFRYDEDWTSSSDAYPLSLSMPIAKPEHSDALVRPFISGLLPDNDEVLRRWGRRFQVSPRNPFRMLRHVGEECAGAVQFVEPDRASDWLAGDAPHGIDWLSEEELEERMRDLVADYAAARRAGDQGQFSLAGAQPKMGLYRDAESGWWGLPKGATPTTHILKPNVEAFQDYDLNEHFCLSLAGRLGLPVARSWVERIGDVPVIVVERFDRTRVDGAITRIHQEDTCQSLARMPYSKYQKDGGPSAAEIFTLIRDYSSKPREDELRFLDAMIFNWLIMGTDAHAKNYSFLLADGAQVRLAPLYDLSSYFPYERANEEKKTKLAMKIGGEYKQYKIGPLSWEKAAGEWKLDHKIIVGRILSQTRGLGESVADIAERMATDVVTDGSVLDRLVEAILKNAEAVDKLYASV